MLAFLLACATEPSRFPAGVPCDWPDDHPLDFYRAPVDVAGTEPGDVLRVQHVLHVTGLALSAKGWAWSDGAHVYRFLYRSEDGEGNPTVVSARVAVPDEVPEGGAPVVAHLHGTWGFADWLAPSREGLALGFEGLLNPMAADMLARGRIVVMTDYPGLGLDGPHPYVVEAPTGKAVLDSVRAVSRLCDASRGVVTPPADAVVLEGHSQGGHAVLAALAWHEAYAPDVALRGAIAFAPPVVSRAMAERMAVGDVPTAPVAMALLGHSYVDPDVRLEDWLQPSVAEALPDRAERDTALGLGLWLDGEPDEIFLPSVVDALARGEWAKGGLGDALDAEDPGRIVSPVPLRVVHGDEDELIPVDLVEDMVARMEGDVELHTLEGAGHLLVPAKAEGEALGWIEELLGR